MSDSEPLILVVEDEAPMRRFLKVSLTSSGYRTAEAETGAEGLSQAAQRNPESIERMDA